MANNINKNGKNGKNGKKKKAIKIMRRVFVTLNAEVVSFMLKANEILKVVDGIPNDAKYIGCWHDFRKDTLNFCFEHPSFDPIPEGNLIPQKEIKIKHYINNK
jgi:hypothetical protein